MRITGGILFALIFTILAAGVSAAENKSKLALEFTNLLPIWLNHKDQQAKAYLNETVVPSLEKKGLRSKLAEAVEQVWTVDELKRMIVLFGDKETQRLIQKFGQVNIMVQNWAVQQVENELKCTRNELLPLALRSTPEYSKFEKSQFCRKKLITN